MQALIFTEAGLADIPLIMDMEAKGFAEGNRELPEVYEARIRTFPQGSLLAWRGSECVGCVFSEIWKASPVPVVEDFLLGHDIVHSHDPVQGTELYITSMTLNPAVRGQGLGHPLFVGAIDQVARSFPQLTSALLLVNETWVQARRIYTAAGFQEIARFAGFFNPHGAIREDGIVMRRGIRG